MFTKYVRGMVYWANIPRYDTNPNLQSGRRPVIIVSNNVANCLSNNVTVVPCTTNTDKNPDQPTHYIVALNPREESLVLCEDIMTIHKSLLEGFMGMLDEQIMKDIDECLKAALGLIDIPNHLLGNSKSSEQKVVEKIIIEPKKYSHGIRIVGKKEQQEFLEYAKIHTTDEIMEKYKIPTKSAVQQRISWYKNKLKEGSLI